VPNMGGEAVSVKSPTVDTVQNGPNRASAAKDTSALGPAFST
jgi:hypothetical protein